MKELIKEFVLLLANSILFICFALASFLLIINVFHFKEISRKQSVYLSENTNYNDYKKSLLNTENKMKSVDVSDTKYKNNAKLIFDNYNICIKSLEKSSFSEIENAKKISQYDLYSANNEILNDYSNICVFNMINTIENVGKSYKYNNSFNNVKKSLEEKQKIMLNNAEYLTKSLLNNSSYSYTTTESRNSIYNKTNNEFKLTVNNYNVLASK